MLYSLGLLTGDRGDLRFCPSSAKGAVDPIRLIGEPIEWSDGTSVAEIIHLNRHDAEHVPSRMIFCVDICREQRRPA